ncbi:MAG: shikimate dehydrogenase family protein [Gaiellaceae bacterium]
MRRVVLLGKPVRESLSPRMQNAAFAAAGLDWRYDALELEPHELAAAVRGLDAGANVTIPYKLDVMALCDEVEPRAVSVNTLVVRDGRILGSSTDGLAIVGAVEARGARALVLGEGGAAKAAVAALEQAGAEVRVASRRGEWPPRLGDATLIVNATPVRDKLLVEPRREHAVVDLAYRASGEPTVLVAAAHAAGCEVVVDGVEILIRQGAASFERWTGLEAPIDAMRAALVA